MDGIEDRITIDPDMLNGKPAIRGKRIAVYTVLDFLASGDSIEEILYHYPTLEKEDIYACIRFASLLMQNNYSIQTVFA